MFKYQYSSYFVDIWATKVYTILFLGPFGLAGFASCACSVCRQGFRVCSLSITLSLSLLCVSRLPVVQVLLNTVQPMRAGELPSFLSNPRSWRCSPRPNATPGGRFYL